MTFNFFLNFFSDFLRFSSPNKSSDPRKCDKEKTEKMLLLCTIIKMKQNFGINRKQIKRKNYSKNKMSGRD